MDEFVYKCIVCDSECKSRPYHEFGECVNMLEDGIICRSHGNYGSTLYDPIPTKGDEFLEFVLCDKCLKERGDKVYRVKLEYRKPLKADEVETYSKYHERNIKDRTED